MNLKNMIRDEFSLFGLKFFISIFLVGLMISSLLHLERLFQGLLEELQNSVLFQFLFFVGLFILGCILLYRIFKKQEEVAVLSSVSHSTSVQIIPIDKLTLVSEFVAGFLTGFRQ